MSKAIVLMSGGIDSSVLAAYLDRCEGDLYGMFFDYGQPAAVNEMRAAKFIADFYCKDFGVVTLPESVIAKNADSDIWPFRNGIMAAIAVNRATKLGAHTVYIGTTREDWDSFPDCRLEFIAALNEAADGGTEEQIRFAAPFSTKRKHEIVKLGRQLGVPLQGTWSCYAKEECGECVACVERAKALSRGGRS